MRKTKIICTLGPATDEETIIKQLLMNGMNVSRLNFSHGTYDEHTVRIEKIKEIRKDLSIPAALLLDTKGPEIRIKTFKEGKINLERGQTFTLTTDDVEGTNKIVSVTYENLPRDLNKMDRVLLDDGLIELKVLNITEKEMECEVINGGPVSNRKGVNVPNVSINLPYISEKDKSDLLFGIEMGFDYVAASFARNADCIKELKKILQDNNGSDIKVIAKIENREGVDNIDEIISVSDGIMVARGDMGVEIPFEELPGIQKSIIKKCYIAGKPVITATQMLDSMIRSPRPTRAEITDVANAVYDGTSALMLSGESAIGKYPVESLLTMSKIAEEAEKDIDYVRRFNSAYIAVSSNVTNAISHATCEAAHTLGASAIISVTKSGHTARIVSKYRPACPIVASTVSEKVFNQLSLSWGVQPVMAEMKSSTDDVFDQAIDRATKTGIVNNGDLVVITGGMPVGVSGTTNTLKVHIVGDVLLEGKGVNSLTATGNVCVVREDDSNLEFFNSGDILVFARSTDGILSAIKHAAAVITEEENENSKAVIVAKALEIPVIYNAISAIEILKSGTIITLDSSKGLVYSGMK